ncbi:histidinol-phosphatase, inositol monophosphatase family [Pseudooceanicola antarcticus]|uniref:Histidinol-phosphatase n=1 Tax=Pseudooceanicola antarcticus TaxID=1247613 RepID=A0A285IQQ5_9RHOB|nr:histidinol-phosphatase [Pseudooceanicola antarcticus]PJE31763.1 histidinol-phosphatase [Pseudooceanicola antarcticus]SNY50355.1 histidinol-phosphatase, inositol monophosphatase family [Pseudooceanicola antarcticus]
MQTTTPLPETDRLADFAASLADTTDAMAMTYFRKPLDIEAKADDSPVTQADRAIEAEMRTHISKAFPTHGILGEEHEDARLDAERIWVIDPIDGTKSFLSGMPSFGTLIACLSGGVPDVGVISIPPTGERWTGQSGAPSRFNGVPCRTSGRQNLGEAILYTTSPDSFDAAGLAHFEALSKKVAMRRFGGDCYAYGLLASGHVDLLFEMNLHPYDYMALVPVIEGAGGVITDWDGQPLTLASEGKVIAAASAELHAQALAVLGHGKPQG